MVLNTQHLRITTFQTKQIVNYPEQCNLEGEYQNTFTIKHCDNILNMAKKRQKSIKMWRFDLTLVIIKQ